MITTLYRAALSTECHRTMTGRGTSTALSAGVGLFPAALSHDIGSETQKPLAVVVIGGLISATILTLIVLPTLYVIFERRYHRKHS